MTIVKSQIRRGPIAQMPILDAGELGLATDENRVFVGTNPITGSVNETDSDNFVAVVTFNTAVNGNVEPIDLDTTNSNSYKVFVNDVEATQFAVDDHIVRIVHGLTDINGNPRAVDIANDVFVLKLNQEITNSTSEGNKTNVEYTQLQNLSGTPLSTGITLDENVKSSVTIDYYIYSNNMSRDGQLRISVNSDMTPVATITDTYNQTGTSDLVFSMDAGELMFTTSSTLDHEFTYKQTSFKKRPVV